MLVFYLLNCHTYMLVGHAQVLPLHGLPWESGVLLHIAILAVRLAAFLSTLYYMF